MPYIERTGITTLRHALLDYYILSYDKTHTRQLVRVLIRKG